MCCAYAPVFVKAGEGEAQLRGLIAGAKGLTSCNELLLIYLAATVIVKLLKYIDHAKQVGFHALADAIRQRVDRRRTQVETLE